LTGASGTLPRSRSPSAPHTSFRTPSHSPATNSRSFELGPSRDGSKLFNGRNGPSPLLKDGAQPQSPYDTLPVGRNTLTQKVSTEELLLPTRSDSSCSLTLESGSKLSDKDVFTSRRQKSGDALTICDSGSEVSDEGYKSSQGNVSKTEEANVHNVPTDSLAKCNESQERPESVMTVGSECSSTISTEDERTNSPGADEESSSPTLTAEPRHITSGLSEKEEAATPEQEIKKATNQLSPTTKNRLASLFNRIPKFGGKTKKTDTETDPPCDPAQQAAQVQASPVKSLPPPAQGRRPRTSPSPALPRNNSRTELTRTRSTSSDNGFNRGGDGRGSYRAPRGTSRYMQAAEAYSQKNQKSASSQLNSTWSASSGSRARSRPGLSSDLFQPPQRQSRTASASPGLHRKRVSSTSKPRSPTSEQPPTISSTHSTPRRRPNGRPTYSRETSRESCLSNVDTDEAILKRMEEILFTYKIKVEDKLAAEGKELPADIFEDFTSHWVNSSPHRAKSVDSLDSSEKSSDRGTLGREVKVAPPQRKESRDGVQARSRIPAPTFYKTSSATDSRL